MNNNSENSAYSPLSTKFRHTKEYKLLTSLSKGALIVPEDDKLRGFIAVVTDIIYPTLSSKHTKPSSASGLTESERKDHEAQMICRTCECLKCLNDFRNTYIVVYHTSSQDHPIVHNIFYYQYGSKTGFFAQYLDMFKIISDTTSACDTPHTCTKTASLKNH